MNAVRPIVMVHGGAGTHPMSRRQKSCLEQALVEGHRLLAAGMPAVDVVEGAIRILEASGLFNAGLGSNCQLDGVPRMDASIMEGSKLGGGAVASLEQVLHPITAARLVMDKTPHVLLVGAAARRFARYWKVEPLPAQAAPRRRSGRGGRVGATSRLRRLYEDMTNAMRRDDGEHRETVGAVALDVRGTVAAGASTGGVDVMLPGRVGDTPLLACGVYADDEAGAVSMTGLGESIIRIGAAKEMVSLLALYKRPVQAATTVLRKLVRRTGGAAGALVLSTSGSFAVRHVTPRMSAGYYTGRGRPFVGDRF